MKVLITYAVEAEFAPWRALRNLETIQSGAVEFRRALVGRATIDFVLTGMGAANARRATETLLSKDYSFCISSGFAGALRSTVKLGEVVVAEKVQTHAPGRAIQCAQNLVRGATSDGAVKIATLLTTDHVVRTAAEKQSLSPFAEAVDMESFAILHVAREKNIPRARHACNFRFL